MLQNYKMARSSSPSLPIHPGNPEIPNVPSTLLLYYGMLLISFSLSFPFFFFLIQDIASVSIIIKYLMPLLIISYHKLR